MAELAMFERMTDDLQARGMTGMEVQAARALWVASPAVPRLPCPLCMVAARWGRLGALLTPRAVERLKCDVCGETIQLSQ